MSSTGRCVALSQPTSRARNYQIIRDRAASPGARQAMRADSSSRERGGKRLLVFCRRCLHVGCNLLELGERIDFGIQFNHIIKIFRSFLVSSYAEICKAAKAIESVILGVEWDELIAFLNNLLITFEVHIGRDTISLGRVVT